MTEPRLILASTSPHRRALLDRFGLAFDCLPPGVEEIRRPGETADALVRRLSRLKAEAVAIAHPGALVIGSDQVAEIGGVVLGKPGGYDAAVEQLRRASGECVTFHTGLCLVDTRDGKRHEHQDITRVHFRTLREDEIQRYLHAEQPYDCAGSFKSEGLGIALFEAIETRDPTALVGLPLIALAGFLRSCGLELP